MVPEVHLLAENFGCLFVVCLFVCPDGLLLEFVVGDVAVWRGPVLREDHPQLILFIVGALSHSSDSLGGSNFDIVC